MIKKIAYKIPVNVIGTDDQGRTLVQCPTRGCGEIAHIDDNGRVVCPNGEAEQEILARIMSHLDDLETAWLTRTRP